MIQRLLIIALFALLWSGCACSKNAAKTSSKVQTPSPTETEKSEPLAEKAKAQPAQKQAEEDVNPCPGKRMEYKGKVTLKGSIGSTKGAQLMLRGVILRIEDRQEARGWVGKDVTATGDLCIYTCGPMEQCLTSGSIKSLKNITIAENPPTP